MSEAVAAATAVASSPASATTAASAVAAAAGGADGHFIVDKMSSHSKRQIGSDSVKVAAVYIF